MYEMQHKKSINNLTNQNKDKHASSHLSIHNAMTQTSQQLNTPASFHCITFKSNDETPSAQKRNAHNSASLNVIQCLKDQLECKKPSATAKTEDYIINSAELWNILKETAPSPGASNPSLDIAGGYND